MAMKRRNRKRSSKAANPPKIAGNEEKPASPSGISSDAEQLASSPNIASEVESLASTPNIVGETEKPAGPTVALAGADRRIHPRYEFIAAVEVRVAEFGAWIETRARDLSQQGCYVDTNNALPLGTVTDVRITKGAQLFEARTRVVYSRAGQGMGLMFTGIEPEQLWTLETWLAESRESSWLAANRRRSQRVLMHIPVRISDQAAAGTSSLFEEETHTLAISAHGALIVVTSPVYRGQRFTLSNVQTKASLECVVVHVDRSSGDQIQVGVDFMLPNSRFWGVAFPPNDWTPRHPDAKFG